MYVLRGYCAKEGTLWYSEKVTSDHQRPTDPCPSCGQIQTCDVHWEEPRPFDDGDIDRIASEYGPDGGCNVFPGGVPGPLKHMRGIRTEELIFVSRHQFTMQRMFGLREKFGMLVQQWRFMDASFAPLIQFRNESQGWQRTYVSNEHFAIRACGGFSHSRL